MATKGLLSSTDRQRQKELEEARKAGLAPAELDEEGKEINPHIPQYMTNAPWYLNNDRPTLKHQRNWKEQLEDKKQWYDRGAKVFQATKWRKGACENCGSMSHKTADCLERPRAKGARWTNKNIAADDKVEEITLASFDAKRDRWNGYDTKDYVRVVERYEQVEALRKEAKQKEQVEQIYKLGAEADAAAAVTAEAAGQADGEHAVDDDVKIHDEEDANFGEVKKRVRTTAGGSTGSVRNLRIREDTAKYLLNLDMNSAHYDPKSRSMREDPNPNKPDTEKQFAGDNFVRQSGDYQAWQALNLHSMTAYDRGQEVHVQALPSLAEMMHKQFKAKKETLSKKNTVGILDKYGNAGEAPPEDGLLLAATEQYVEYDRSGRIIKGQETKARSRYEEDVLINNHTSVWGSWWHDGTWGYTCCHQTVKNSYCTGKAGERAAAETAAQMVANMEAKARELAAREATEAANGHEHEDEAARASTLSNAHLEKADVWGAEAAPDLELDAEKLAAAIKAQAAADKAVVETDERKRKYNSLKSSDAGVSVEEMEAYRLKKGRGEDPMAAVQGSGTNGYDLL